MKAITAKYRSGIARFLLATLVLSGGFFYYPAQPAKALETRTGIVLFENVTGLSFVPSSGSAIEADDESTHIPEEFLFYPLTEDQVIGYFNTEKSFKIRFKTSSSQINFSLYSGSGTIFAEGGTDSALHYYDLSLPAGTKAQVEVSANSVGQMKIDSDNNGSYETTPTASYFKLGSTVTDTEPPILTYDQNGTNLAVTAEDQNQVKNIYYSFSERSGRLSKDAKKYTNSISLSSLNNGDIVYFLSEDTVGNRGFWEPFYYNKDGQSPSPSLTPTPTPVVNPTPTPTNIQVPSYVNSNIKCGTDVVYYVNAQGQREAYPSAEVYFVWNSSFDQIQYVEVETCNAMPYIGLTRLPANSLVKVSGNQTVWKIDGGVAYPIASYGAMLKIQAKPNIITISIPYLHTYSGGETIY